MFWRFSVHFPSNRGIATPVCALARNDSVYFAKHQFICRITPLCGKLIRKGKGFYDRENCCIGGEFCH